MASKWRQCRHRGREGIVINVILFLIFFQPLIANCDKNLNYDGRRPKRSSSETANGKTGDDLNIKNGTAYVFVDGIRPEDSVDEKKDVDIGAIDRNSQHNCDNFQNNKNGESLPEPTRHSSESCFTFPTECSTNSSIDCWTHPDHLTLALEECGGEQRIEVLRVVYIRPNERGDSCSSHSGCYMSSCCCRQYPNNCSLAVNKSYTDTEVFSSVSKACDNRTSCSVTIQSVMMERLMGPGMTGMGSTVGEGVMELDTCLVTGCQSGDRGNRLSRCWARVVRVEYLCHAVAPITGGSGVPYTPGGGGDGEQVTSTTTPGTAGHSYNLALLLGLCAAAGTILILFIVAVIICICRRRRKKMRDESQCGHEKVHIQFSAGRGGDSCSTTSLCRPDPDLHGTDTLHVRGKNAATLNWQYPGGETSGSTLHGDEGNQSILRQPLPDIPTDLVENTYYEGFPEKSDVEEPPSISGLGENFYAGVASACSAIGYDIEHGTKSEDREKPKDDQQIGNNLTNQPQQCRDGASSSNNNSQYSKNNAYNEPRESGIENLYETIPEVGLKGRKYKSELKFTPISNTLDPSGRPSVNNNTTSYKSSDDSHNPTNKNGNVKYKTENFKNRSLINNNNDFSNSRAAQNKPFNRGDDLNNRNSKYKYNGPRSSKVDMDVPLIPPSDKTLKSRNTANTSRIRTNSNEDDNYTYAYDHFMQDNKARNDGGRTRGGKSSDNSVYAN